MQSNERSHAGARIALVDVARGVALVAMAVYHFTWDLEFFGYVPAGMPNEGGWRLFARLIASSFLFLVGFSLVLAHGRGIRWWSFWKRWATVAGGAALVTVATWFAINDSFVFFGILHEIALASILGLAFLRVPPLLTLTVAAAVFTLPLVFSSVVFDTPRLWWVGLSTFLPRSMDFVPVFPWFAAVLAGIAAGRAARSYGILPKLAAIATPRWAWPLDLAGRHSLLVYLVHQPVLLGALALFNLVWPPAVDRSPETFLSECSRVCSDTRGAPFCERYCGCMLNEIVVADRLDEVFDRSQNTETRRWVGELAGQCTALAETAPEEGQ